MTQINALRSGSGRNSRRSQIKPWIEHGSKRAEPGTRCHDQDRLCRRLSAIAASLFVAFPSLSPQVGASAPIIGAKGDRADVRPLGTECGEKAWPYFDAACTRDARIPLAQPRDVRMIAADRAAN